jgi:endoglucanase Acf2
MLDTLSCRLRGTLTRGSVFLLLAMATSLANAAEVALAGGGSYLRGLPEGLKGPDAKPRRTESLRGAAPTNDWWSAALWTDKSFPEFPHPLAVKPEAAGFRLAQPKVNGTKNDIFGAIPGGDEDIVLRHPAVEKFAPPLVDGASDWTVTLLFAEGASKLRVTYGHGSPFVYALYEGGAPRLRFAAVPKIWAGDAKTATIGMTFAGKHYGIFAPTGAQWRGLDTVQWDCETTKPYFSVAALPDDKPETLALFAKVAHHHVTDTQVRWAYDPASSVVSTEFKFITKTWEGTGQDTIFALYPHQWRHVTTPLLPKEFASLRGTMKLAQGESFVTRMTFPGILPALPDSGVMPRERLAATIAEDAARGLGNVKDTYAEGKQLGRISTLLGIADAAGISEEAARLHQMLAERLELWFTADAAKTKGVFAYEPVWGTLIGYPASFGSEDQINDHHFHYGYFIRAAAELARRDPAWASDTRWGGMVRMLIRDIASADRKDPLFPFLRTFDPYAGHTWASGHARFGDGNNNESSSEALNAWAGVTLFGEAVGDRALRDLGVWLFTTELNAIEENWFNVHEDNFPKEYQHPVVTMVWGGKGVHGTWFSGNPEAIYGINWLPFTATSLYLGRFPRHAEKCYQALLTENAADDAKKAAKSGKPAPELGNSWDTWPDLMRMYRAITDPDDALSQQAAAESRGKLDIEAGNSRTNLLQWLNAFKTFGRVESSVTANTPCYAVFQSGAERTYFAWNLTAKPVDVRFSDGAKLTAPAGKLAKTTVMVRAAK